MEVTIKSVVDSRLEQLTQRRLEVAQKILDKYVEGETITNALGNGKFEYEVLIPNFAYFMGFLNMCCSMQNEKFFSAADVIQSWLIYLHQTPEGLEEQKLLKTFHTSYEIELGTKLYTGKKIKELMKLQKV